MPTWSMSILEQDQQRWKAFVDRHRGHNEECFEIGKFILMFHTRCRVILHTRYEK